MEELWLKAALVRAIKTFAQTMLSLLTVGQAITEIDWLAAVSVSATAAICSILTSIVTGMPEVDTSEDPLGESIDGRLVMEHTDEGMKMGMEFGKAISTIHDGDIFRLKVTDKDTEENG